MVADAGASVVITLLTLALLIVSTVVVLTRLDVWSTSKLLPGPAWLRRVSALYRRWSSKAELVHEAAFPVAPTALEAPAGDFAADIRMMIEAPATCSLPRWSGPRCPVWWPT